MIKTKKAKYVNVHRWCKMVPQVVSVQLVNISTITFGLMNGVISIVFMGVIN